MFNDFVLYLQGFNAKMPSANTYCHYYLAGESVWVLLDAKHAHTKDGTAFIRRHIEFG